MTTRWIDVEMQTLDLGDERRESRCRLLLGDLAARPNVSVPQAVGAQNADVQAAYRFFANPNISVEDILAPHAEATRRRIAQQASIVLVQDTTELDETRPQQVVQGAGPLDEGSRRGGFCHAMHAFSEAGTPLGTVWSKLWSRPEPASKKRGKAARQKARAAARKRPIEDKESFRWVEGIQAAGALSLLVPQTDCVCIADSEADVFEVFAQTLAGAGSAEVLIRACQDRAVVPEVDVLAAESSSRDIAGTVWAAVEQAPVLSTAAVAVRARTAKVSCETRGRRQPRIARDAVVAVRATSVMLRGCSRPGGRLPDVRVNVVLVREINPPADDVAVEWLLVTTLPIDTVAQVERVVALYALRWRIELFFRTLKQGCQVEAKRFEYHDRLERFLAIALIVAWRVAYLCHLGRECPEISCEVVFTREEWQVAHRVLRREEPPHTPPLLPEMIRLVAQMGGYINRVREDEPGIQTLWQGLQRLHDMTLCWQLFSPEAKNTA